MSKSVTCVTALLTTNNNNTYVESLWLNRNAEGGMREGRWGFEGGTRVDYMEWCRGARELLCKTRRESKSWLGKSKEQEQDLKKAQS